MSDTLNKKEIDQLMKLFDDKIKVGPAGYKFSNKN